MRNLITFIFLTFLFTLVVSSLALGRQAKSFAGRWQTNFGTLEIEIVGNQAFGSYTHDNGKIKAFLSSDGKTMEGIWSEAPTYKPPRDAGKFILVLSEDGNSFQGKWGYGERLDGGEWTGTRINDTPPPRRTPSTPSESKVIFQNGNKITVHNHPTRPTTFTLHKPHMITLIQNYHWNYEKGAEPGTIALRDQSGKIYGPWQAEGLPGYRGVPNAYWNVYPNIVLPAGVYTIIDSDPSTWSQNEGSAGAGFAKVEGYPVDSSEKYRGSTKVFSYPSYNGYRVDICRVWGKECGKPAADAFCERMGYIEAESWEIEHDIGHITPTIVMETGQVCDRSFCDGFKYIRCISR